MEFCDYRRQYCKLGVVVRDCVMEEAIFQLDLISKPKEISSLWKGWVPSCLTTVVSFSMAKLF